MRSDYTLLKAVENINDQDLVVYSPGFGPITDAELYCIPTSADPQEVEDLDEAELKQMIRNASSSGVNEDICLLIGKTMNGYKVWIADLWDKFEFSLANVKEFAVLRNQSFVYDLEDQTTHQACDFIFNQTNGDVVIISLNDKAKAWFESKGYVTDGDDNIFPFGKYDNVDTENSMYRFNRDSMALNGFVCIVR
jgi:hypothetical protein